MTPQELEAKIKIRIREAQRKKIWERADDIVSELGKFYRRVELWYTITIFKLSLVIDGVELAIEKSNYITGCNYIYIYVNRDTVFHAEEVAGAGGEVKIKINAYKPGTWEKLLNLRCIRSAQVRAQRLLTHALVEESRGQAETEKVRPLTDDEKRKASDFGISYN